MVGVCLSSQSAPEKRKKPTNLCAPPEFLKQMCRPCFIIIKSCYLDYIINKPFICSRCFCSRDLDVLRAQRIMGFFITHKSTRSETPITWRARGFEQLFINEIVRCIMQARQTSLLHVVRFIMTQAVTFPPTGRCWRHLFPVSTVSQMMESLRCIPSEKKISASVCSLRSLVSLG